MQYINLKTLERNKVTTLVMRKYFLMYWGVLLFGVAALTSCVQDYLYEVVYYGPWEQSGGSKNINEIKCVIYK